jgi:hypothetical protein
MEELIRQEGAISTAPSRGNTASFGCITIIAYDGTWSVALLLSHRLCFAGH